MAPWVGRNKHGVLKPLLKHNLFAATRFESNEERKRRKREKKAEKAQVKDERKEEKREEKMKKKCAKMMQRKEMEDECGVNATAPDGQEMEE